MRKYNMIKKITSTALAAVLIAAGSTALGAVNAFDTTLTTQTVNAAAVRSLADNGSYLSKSETYINSSIRAYARFTGGTGPYRYKYSYRYENGAWVDVTSYISSDSKAVKLPSSPGKYTIRVAASDANGAYSSKYLYLKVKKDTKTAFKETGSFLSSTATWVNWTITANAKFSGGVEPYTYKYSYRKDGGSWIDVTGYITSGSKTIKMPSESGNYTVRIAAIDANGTYSSKYLSLKVRKDTKTSFKENGSSLSSTSTWANWTITANGRFSGGVEPYTYKYSFRKGNGAWSDLTSYVNNAGQKIQMPSEAGFYSIRIAAKDAAGKYSSKYINITVKKDTKTSFRDNGSDAVTYTFSGGPMIARADYTGGVLPYQYKYSYKYGSGNWVDIKNYSENTSGIFNMPYKSGNYTVRIAVKDATGKYLSKYFSVYVTIDKSDEYEMAKTASSRIIRSSMTDVQKAKTIHDWIINNTRYDIENFYSGTIPYESYTTTGVLKNHVAVCQGYAEAFQAMALNAGLDTELTTGKANGIGGYGGHAWNQVKVDNIWYNIDVTWDDPVSSTDMLVYDYFLIPDYMIETDHIFDRKTRNCTAPTPDY